MKITIIRHADPDYEHNTLTPTGFKEAEALKKHFELNNNATVYASPLNRAKLTAEAISSNITICPWLKEFDHLIMLPNQNEKVITWDFLPSFYTSQKDLYNNDKYLDTEIFKSGNIKKYYQEVCSSLDELLSQHGYIRENNYYRVEKESEDEIILVCHFGMMSVLMSHLMNIPYVIIANTMCCPPTGITRFVSEERKQGVAHFRCLCFGETPHLVLENYKPSFAARFCETFSSKDRH